VPDTGPEEIMPARWLVRSVGLLPAALLAAVAVSPGCGSDDEAEALYCEGEQCNLACADGDPSCSAVCSKGADCDLDCNGAECDLDCQSKSTCDVDCSKAGGCDADCEGQSTCKVDCTNASDCNLDCAGGSTCDITCKGDCGGGCAGTSTCNLTCESACGVGCTGTSTCSVSCTKGCFICCDGSAQCDLKCTDAEVTECMTGGGTRVLVCGRECPADDECKNVTPSTTDAPM
jgi:hypothetical protein